MQMLLLPDAWLFNQHGIGLCEKVLFDVFTHIIVFLDCVSIPDSVHESTATVDSQSRPANSDGQIAFCVSKFDL